ncbi:MAG: ribonuclease domain-containing protein [Burkholderiales bacterium]
MTLLFPFEPASAAEIAFAALPPEARETLALIRLGGPFPYRQDGGVFGNRERLLPPKERGYYREYTVKTPGARDRGARRIVSGGEPRASREFYYSDDHYRSFSSIRE